jgi:metallophosphoesterase (TIGR00282 family)
VKFLFIGDIVGRGGRKVFSTLIPKLKEEYKIDILIANAENSANGFGITEKVYKELIKNADILTTGNHIWDQKNTLENISEYEFLIRPANYPPETPGQPYKEIKPDIIIYNLMGRVFMPTLDCPFRTFDNFYKYNKDKVIIVDFHAEATSEKQAFAHYVDGRATAVIGTHTHVQTNDDRILPKGTLYISDVGMCGAIDSVIGMKKDAALKRLIHGLPAKLEVEKKGKMMLNALFFEINTKKEIIEFKKVRLEHGG